MAAGPGTTPSVLTGSTPVGFQRPDEVGVELDRRNEEGALRQAASWTGPSGSASQAPSVSMLVGSSRRNRRGSKPWIGVFAFGNW